MTANYNHTRPEPRKETAWKVDLPRYIAAQAAITEFCEKQAAEQQTTTRRFKRGRSVQLGLSILESALCDRERTQPQVRFHTGGSELESFLVVHLGSRVLVASLTSVSPDAQCLRGGRGKLDGFLRIGQRSIEVVQRNPGHRLRCERVREAGQSQEGYSTSELP